MTNESKEIVVPVPDEIFIIIGQQTARIRILERQIAVLQEMIKEYQGKKPKSKGGDNGKSD